MEELWTPWRMRYIQQSGRPEGCIFCEKPKEPDTDALILRRGAHVFTVLNLYPYVVGHLMVIPYRHLGRLSLLTPEERDEAAEQLRQAERILRVTAGARRFQAGINLGRAAGAGVDGHLHIHLVPRETTASWSGEAGDPEELPVPVQTVYERLRDAFTGSA